MRCLIESNNTRLVRLNAFLYALRGVFYYLNFPSLRFMFPPFSADVNQQTVVCNSPEWVFVDTADYLYSFTPYNI